MQFVCDFPTSDTPPTIIPDAIHKLSFDPPEPSEPFAPFTNYSATSFSVKKKVSYSQKKRISVEKSQGKVKKKSKKLTFP